jgi:hypothetical protein
MERGGFDGKGVSIDDRDGLGLLKILLFFDSLRRWEEAG